MRPEILDIAESHGHKVFESGQYNVNIIGVRSPNHQPNRFDDVMHCVYRDENDEWVHKSWQCTTEPGTYWLENPSRVAGTAILVPGQYRGVYKIGKHRGKYDALVQHGAPVKVYRDSNKDEIIDAEVGTSEEGFFGINIHKAGEHSTQINKWSAGCQVFAVADDFSEFMDICYKARDKWGDSFSYTLIVGEDKQVT